MKIETTIERIEKLIDHMETVPDEKFNFGVWGSSGFEPGKSCGTVGCTIGHATTMPYFAELGLSLYKSSAGIYPIYDKNGTKILGEYGLAPLHKVFGGTNVLMQKLFIPEAGPDYLSVSSTPKQWAVQARKIVAELRKKHNIPEPAKQTASSGVENSNTATI